MHTFRHALLVLTLAALGSLAFAQAEDDADDAEQLRIAAIEALISAPPERALPIVTRVLQGDDSDDVKEGALFVLSQLRVPEAQELLIEVARTGNRELREEAVRMIGIGGNPAAMATLKELYRDGDEDMREAVLEAFLIADDAEAVFAIAEAAQSADEFEEAVETLGAMGATEQLRALRNRDGMSEVLIEAYAMAGDIATLRELALDGSDPKRQGEALEGLAIAGDDGASAIFKEIYRTTDNDDLKEAVLDALLIQGDDDSALELFRESDDPADKKELLELLVHMDSDAVWDIIDATLENR